MEENVVRAVVALCITALGIAALIKGIDHATIAAASTVLGWVLGYKTRRR